MDNVFDISSDSGFGALTQVLRLRKACITRWNSVYSMLVRILQLRRCLLKYEDEHGESILLTRDDWITIHDIVDLLGPIKALVVRL